jgi:hypothetical protein
MRYVEHAIVLDIRPFSNADVMDVASYHAVEPNAAVSADRDVTDDSCPFRKEYRRVDLRLYTAI